MEYHITDFPDSNIGLSFRFQVQNVFISVHSKPDAPAPPGGEQNDDSFSEKSDSDDTDNSDDFD